MNKNLIKITANFWVLQGSGNNLTRPEKPEQYLAGHQKFQFFLPLFAISG
jgi:hypothetical protein